MQRKKQIIIMVLIIILLFGISIFNHFYKTNNNIPAKQTVIIDNDKIKIQELSSKIIKHQRELRAKDKEIKDMTTISRHLDEFYDRLKNAKVFKVSCYDLSLQSCGKRKGDKNYGITANGFSLQNKTWKTARTIAVDTNIVPMNSIVYIQFLDKKYSKFDGIFYVRDTGGGVDGYHIDFFLGDFQSDKPDKSTYEFGVTKAKVTLLK